MADPYMTETCCIMKTRTKTATFHYNPKSLNLSSLSEKKCKGLIATVYNLLKCLNMLKEIQV